MAKPRTKRFGLSAARCAVAGFAIGLLLARWWSGQRVPRLSQLGSFQGLNTLTEDGARPKIKAFIGIQTGFTTDYTDPKYNYEERREALRLAWVPATEEQRKRLLEEHRIVIKFVIGHSEDAAADAALAEEEARYGGFMRLELVESYHSLTRKSLLYFTAVLQNYDPDYIFKVDDDVFLRPDRVVPAITQWSSMGADYIGCMVRGAVFKSPTHRWYEPEHELLGGHYFTHAVGAAYVLSAAGARKIVNQPSHNLRRLANEDVTVGLWMVALNATFLDDRRMCSAQCTEASIVVYDVNKCQGMCQPSEGLLERATDPRCNTPALPDLPMLKQKFWFKTPEDLEKERRMQAAIEKHRVKGKLVEDQASDADEEEPWRAGATAALHAVSLVEREKSSAVGTELRGGDETVSSGEASSESFGALSRATTQEQGAENDVQQTDTVTKPLVVDVQVEHQTSDAAKMDVEEVEVGIRLYDDDVKTRRKQDFLDRRGIPDQQQEKVLTEEKPKQELSAKKK